MVQKMALTLLFIINILNTICPQSMLINLTQKSQESVKVVDKIIERKDKNLCLNVVIPEIKYLNNVDKENEINLNISNNTAKWIRGVEEITKEYFQDGIQTLFPYEANSRYKVVRNDKKFISLYIDYYQFTGGAHGITNRVAYTIDMKTDDILLLNDLFKDGFNYKKVINGEIKKQISKNKDMYFDEGTIFKGIKEDEKFYIDRSNLVIYFNQYEIAPYSAGIIGFSIPISLFKDNFI